MKDFVRSLVPSTVTPASALSKSLSLASVRPLIRYVDEDQAILDVCFQVQPAIPRSSQAPPAPMDAVLDVLIGLDSEDGFHDEGQTRLQLDHGSGAVRFEVVHPQRWWPAGMGEQALYQLSLSLQMAGEVLDERHVSVGLTSVRRNDLNPPRPTAPLLVNGQLCDIQNLVPIDWIDEQALLPVSGRSLLLVRDHYGTEALYDAADRAGILLVQCVPVDAEAAPERLIRDQIDRLSSHPSLAGYFVGHLGELSQTVARHIQALDPTRGIFHKLPEGLAA